VDSVNIELGKLHLDRENPRIKEFGINRDTSEKRIIETLWDSMDLKELLMSITSKGYWQYEPVIVIEHPKLPGEYIVLEGNRRLAAVKLIDNISLIERTIPASVVEKIQSEDFEKISEIPAIVVANREESWHYIGFKHVNGPQKWNSYAKAKYIAEVHNQYGVPIETISENIGDTNRNAQKLYQGLMILDQAERETSFSIDDVNANRIYFSHLYTGIHRKGIRDYLDLSDVELESPNPVKEEKLKDLEEFLVWMFGSKKENKPPVIRSQNPDLKNLETVLGNKEATYALRSGSDILACVEIAEGDSRVFEENLWAAKRSIHKAFSNIPTGYLEKEDGLFKVALDIERLATRTVQEMIQVHESTNSDPALEESNQED